MVCLLSQADWGPDRIREVFYGQHSNFNGPQILICLPQGGPVMISKGTLQRQMHIRQVAGHCTLNGGDCIRT